MNGQYADPTLQTGFTPGGATLPVTDFTKAFSQNNLLPGQKTLDPDSQNRLQNQINDAINNFSSRRTFVDSGNAATQNLVPGAGQIASSPINSSVPGLAGALAERAQRQYGDTMQSAKTLSDINSPYQQFSRLSQLGKQQNQFEQLQIKNYKEQVQYVAQQRQAYNEWLRAKQDAQSSFLGSLLGGVGMLAGAALAGPLGLGVAGSMGAMGAGGAVGGAVGKGL